MSRFPSQYQIGQGTTPDELNVEKGISSSKGKRLRDRDNYAKAIMTGGNLAPEVLNVKSLVINGFVKSPWGLQFSGLHAANQSSFTSIDVRDWFPYQTWHNLIRWDVSLGKVTIAHVTANAAVTCLASRWGGVYLGLFVNGIPVCVQYTQWNFLASPRPKGFKSEPFAVTWAGSLSPGVNTFQFMFFVQYPPTGWGQMFIQGVYSPHMSILLL